MSAHTAVQWGQDLEMGEDLLRVIAQWLTKDETNWLVEVHQWHTDERLDGLLIGFVDLALNGEKVEGLLIMPTVEGEAEPADDATPVFVRLVAIRTLTIP